MTKYKIKMIYPDGEEVIEDDIFDSYEEAEDAALYYVSCTRDGAETLNLSNPGDYEYDEETYVDPTYEIIEID